MAAYNVGMHQAVIIVAKDFILLSVLVAAWVFIEQPRNKKLEFVLIALVGAVLSYAFAKLGSHFFYDTRPFVAGHFTPYFSHGNDNGFPSDHTLFASFLMYLSWRYSKKWGLVLFVLAVLIGLSRVQAGVHHLIDILGSFACAGLGVGTAILLVGLFHKQQSTYTTTPKR